MARRESRWQNADEMHDVVLTGKQRKYKPRGKGAGRVNAVQLQYTCSCGFTGWSAHTDLVKLGRTAKGKRVRLKTSA